VAVDLKPTMRKIGVYETYTFKFNLNLRNSSPHFRTNCFIYITGFWQISMYWLQKSRPKYAKSY